MQRGFWNTHTESQGGRVSNQAVEMAADSREDCGHSPRLVVARAPKCACVQKLQEP